MIGNSLLTQVVVAGIAIGIIFTYIQPALGEIKLRQDEIDQTKEEFKKVTDVNARLAELYAQINAIPQRDKGALITYLPDYVDEVRVLKDLSLIANDAKVKLIDVSYGGSASQVSAVDESEIITHTFSMNLESSYEGLKNTLSYLERNNYPIVVETMDVTPTEGGFLDVTLSLITYSTKEKDKE